MAGGIISGWAIPLVGWEPVFIGAGIFSFALAPIAWFGLPESLRYLSQSARNNARVLAQLRQLRSDLPDELDSVEFPPEATSRRSARCWHVRTAARRFCCGWQSRPTCS